MNRIVAIGMLVLMTGVRVEGKGDRNSPVSVMRFEDDGLRLKSRPVRAEVGTNQTLFIRALIRIPGSPSSIDIEIPNATVGTFSRAKVKGFRCSYSQMASSDGATTYHAGPDFTVTITKLGKVGEVIEGTFSGTVARKNGEVRELTNGTFWAIRQAPEPVAKKAPVDQSMKPL